MRRIACGKRCGRCSCSGQAGREDFRVDNPDTKPLPFWEWLIREIRQRDPDVLFLSEAVHPAEGDESAGEARFTQSYTYFTLAHPQGEIQEYLERADAAIPSAITPAEFSSTRDIRTASAAKRRAWMFKSRFALALTLSSNYGIYNGSSAGAHPSGSRAISLREVRDQVPQWNKPGHIKDYIGRLNGSAREPALLQTSNLSFCRWTTGITGFLKQSVDGKNAIACAMPCQGRQEFWLHFGDHLMAARRFAPGADDREPCHGEKAISSGMARVCELMQQDPALLFRCHAEAAA